MTLFAECGGLPARRHAAACHFFDFDNTRTSPMTMVLSTALHMS
jgi:hypothetical protein